MVLRTYAGFFQLVAIQCMSSGTAAAIIFMFCLLLFSLDRIFGRTANTISLLLCSIWPSSPPTNGSIISLPRGDNL